MKISFEISYILYIESIKNVKRLDFLIILITFVFSDYKEFIQQNFFEIKGLIKYNFVKFR